MSTDSVNDPGEGQKQVCACDDTVIGAKNPEHFGTNDHPKKRRDTGRTHVTRCGLLSRDIVRALVRGGENVRTIRRYEKQFRAFFKPEGPLGEYFFDRWWSCYLRLHLLASLEAERLRPTKSHRRPAIEHELREGNLPALVTTDLTEFEIAQRFDFDLPQDLVRELAFVARHDAHFSREMNRMLEPLLVMREGGEAGLIKWMADGREFTKIQKG